MIARRVLVTGASGFVGRALVHELLSRDFLVTASSRSPIEFPSGVRAVRVGDLGPDTDWAEALRDCDAVVHCAARVHVMAETATDPLVAFRMANVEGTVRLAMQARDAGVKRFVHLSSIKVNGEGTPRGRPFTERDAPAPADPYGVSKLEGERRLRHVAEGSALQLVVIRPPLVYGPGVRANFLSMSRWIARGTPLPFGCITQNRRSLVGLDNLLDLIATCLTHPAAAGETFLVSDGEDLSTTELLRRTAAALGTPARLVPVPVAVLSLGARVLGRGGLWQRLGGSLQVDITHARTRLGWSPPVTVDEGLHRAVQAIVRSGASE